MFHGEAEPELERWETDGDLVAHRVSAANPHAAVLFMHGFATHLGRHAAKLHVLAERGNRHKAALGGRPRNDGDPLVIDLTEGNGGKQVLDICSSELCA